jgi:hypothetical protein
VIPGGQHHRGLRQKVDSENGNAYPMSRRPRRWRSAPVPDSSQITTVDPPISMSESRPNPARATDRAETAAMARTTIPATFQALRHGDGIYLRLMPGDSGHLMELMTNVRSLPEILEAREALETQLVGLAVARRTEEDIAAMADALSAMAAAINGGGLGEDGDRLFHGAIGTRAARCSPSSWPR